jgi:hypothetical protein
MKFKLGQTVFAESEEYGIVKGPIFKLDAGISRDAVVILDKQGNEIVMLEERCRIHILDEATKMVAQWKRGGFNGVRFCECYVEKVNTLEDFLSDGFTKEDHEQFIKDYVVFVASPQEPLEFGDDNEYTSVRFNQRKFFQDLYREMGSILGTDIEIIHRPSCHEFEVSRKKQA